ncbi:flavin reductase family protein [Salipaludibacillus sp. LMS25]|jgi:flavin reductase (DIM6/NTAB) family NADH-FMN oxidoreductase RutF|uniref:flavin reductase family protein n=1 Tax=Salipaludibacillus sp. LMS25 TaxID=2924031 RepID=UPI0020D0BDE0|nr:flavin reductase family protein [Salipaludibacillus sp. LMS25]UTR13900.1 flavin reductase family protein [Salipaludibacillus sp. LMS25]
MAFIDPTQWSKKENYQFLTTAVTPRPIAWVTSLSSKGILNAAPFSYFNLISADPPLLSVSIGRRAGELKDTARNISETGEFVVHVVDEDNVGASNETAANLPANESEVVKTGLTEKDSHRVAVPSLKESRIRLECRLEKHLTFEGKEAMTDVIIGEIVGYDVDDEILTGDNTVDIAKLKPVSRLGGKQYASLGAVFEIDRPN